MSAKSKGRSRLAIRYFDDRVLLTDMHAWAYYRVPSVSYEFTTPDEREALATNITVALAAIRMQDAEVHLRIAHRPYPAVEWATGLDNTLRRRPRLAGVPGADLPARVGEGLLVQGDLHRGPARPAVHARPAHRRPVRALPEHLPGRRARPRHRGRRGAGRRDRQVDGAGGAARPRAHRVRARRPARELPRGGVAVPAHADGLARRPAAVGDPPPGLGQPARSSSCTRARCTMAARCSGSSRSRATRGWRSSRSPASPT